MQSDRLTVGESFKVDKAVAAISYLVSRTAESLYPVLKMLYLADRCHLERYGRFIVGDRYVAMEKGPVPSRTYDMLKFVRGDRSFFDGGDAAKQAFALDRQTHKFSIYGVPSFEALSESDVECLEEVANLRAQKGSNFIRNASHDDAWKATTRNSDIAVEAIAAQFDDGPSLVQHLLNRHPN
ncbi:MAG TPA: Panacea domain-containing protein [Terracidiphilus sp.]|nr:Panacea domain-containing protein [Terracidiphilus sp.]